MAIGRVQEALDKSELTLHYQPKVDMRRGVVLGLEALLRWDHPQHGLIAPMQFLPLIENSGLSSRVGDWVLSQAPNTTHRPACRFDDQQCRSSWPDRLCSYSRRQTGCHCLV